MAAIKLNYCYVCNKKGKHCIILSSMCVPADACPLYAYIIGQVTHESSAFVEIKGCRSKDMPPVILPRAAFGLA